MATIEELERLKCGMEREARKWTSYLDSLDSREAREKELARKLMEAWLEGSSGRLPEGTCM